MKISELIGSPKSQYELDFIDIDTDKDIPLFIDPYFISKQEFPFAEDAYTEIKSYFDFLLALLKQKKFAKAKEIFSYLSESNETCLGMSKGRPSGRGMGPTDAEKIFKSLLESKAYKTGLMEDIEDVRIFVPNVDKDKISDMTTNIIRWHLIKYTQEQCKLWNIKLQSGVPSGFYWDSKENDWCNTYTDMLIVNDKKILLVPKRIVSFSKTYTDKNYLQFYVLNFLQNEHLRLQSPLVRKRVKTKEQYVTKKDIFDLESSKATIDKNWLATFTLKHPDVFAAFKKQTIKHISPISNEDIEDINLAEVLGHLKTQLQNTPAGTEYASQYHHTILGIMELLFYPYLSNPKIEEEIHDGRKRIDITFDNCAESGFFFRLGTSYNVPSRFIIIECKNYSRDIKNPELDQLSGRFSPNRGKFGIATCRKIEDIDLFIKRCNDTAKDERGIIIPLVDEDFIYMLDHFEEDQHKVWEDILQKKFSAVTLK